MSIKRRVERLEGQARPGVAVKQTLIVRRTVDGWADETGRPLVEADVQRLRDAGHQLIIERRDLQGA